MICGVFYKSSALLQGLVWCQGPAEGLSTEGLSGFTFITVIRAGSFTVVSFSSERPNDQSSQANGVKHVELSQQRLEEEPWHWFLWNVHFSLGCSVLFGSWSAWRPQQTDQRNTWVVSSHYWEQIGSSNRGFPWNYIRAIQYFHPEMMKWWCMFNISVHIILKAPPETFLWIIEPACGIRSWIPGILCYWKTLIQMLWWL